MNANYNLLNIQHASHVPEKTFLKFFVFVFAFPKAQQFKNSFFFNFPFSKSYKHREEILNSYYF